MIKNFLLAAAGGAIGSAGRYLLSLLASQLLLRPEYATLTANIVGSFLIGLAGPGMKNEWMLFYTVGICGGFTTFSTFSSQTLRLLHSGQYAAGALYALASVAVSLGMVACGWYCRQKCFG